MGLELQPLNSQPTSPCDGDDDDSNNDRIGGGSVKSGHTHKSNRSTKSNLTNLTKKSNKSNKSNKSHNSDKSNKSDKTNKSDKSNRSDNSGNTRYSTYSNFSTSSRGSASGSGKQFNPRLIFSQIVAVQSLHYLVLSMLFQFNGLIFGTSVTVDRIFTGNYLNVWTAEGWIDNGAVLTSSVVGAFLLAFIVEKSKKCLDFSFTVFTVHLVLCSLYDGRFPRSWDWWIVHVLGMIVMVLTGEYLCSRVEMREIPTLL